MANEEQLSILRQGVKIWNTWREENPLIRVDLSGTDLSGAKFSFVNLSDANLSGINFNGAELFYADLSKANLSESNLGRAKLGEANLSKANLDKTNLSEASLSGASLRETNLSFTDLSGADLNDSDLSSANLHKAYLGNASLIRANLSEASLIGTSLPRTNLSEANLSGADFSGVNLISSNLIKANVNNVKISNSNVYGANVWDLKGEFKEQKDLIITPLDESSITVDNIKVAQFVYLLLNNRELRDVINTLTSKTVLILGRFSIPERKAILDALRNKLREYDLLPIVFDFDRPTDKDFTETIKTLAGISYFVIADVTNPKSSPLELQATIPDYQIPFVPIIQEGESPFAMMVDLQKKYPWVLPTRSYDSIETLMSALKPGIIDPAVEMRNKLRLVKAQEQVTESLRDYVYKTL
ncbi:MAG: pentapeptide repeat-containing protein [Anaerolineales bacterium]|nr:pentapeptide repeat-containing protein [Anaerolineales bacterium]